MTSNIIENQELKKPGFFENDEESFYPIFLHNKNTPSEYNDLPKINLLFNDNIRDNFGDKECSLAAAPLRNSCPYNNNDLNGNYNMECPEVVNKKKEDSLNINKEDLQKIINFDKDDFVGFKPLSSFILFPSEKLNDINNSIDSIINNLENNDAPINIFPLNDSFSSKNVNPNSLQIMNQSFDCNVSHNDKNVFLKKDVNNKNSKESKIINIKKKEGFKDVKLKVKMIQIRKLKPDSLRKKIKSRVHKKIKDIINSKLKKAGSKMIFEHLPQPFIKNIKIDYNKNFLNFTMKDLLKMNIGNKKIDRDKVNRNRKTLEYIDSQQNIKYKNISSFLDNSYENILQDYFSSQYFLDDIEKLKKEGESNDYIIKYKFIGEHWLEFYKNNGKILFYK